MVWGVIEQRVYHSTVNTAIDQWRKRLQGCACARVVHILNTFCERTLANNLHFYVFGSSGFCPWCQMFTVLMVDRPTLLNCKALSLLRTVNEQKVKCSYLHGVNL